MSFQAPTLPKDLHYMLKPVFSLVALHIRLKKYPAPWFDKDGYPHWSNEYFEYTLKLSYIGMPVLIKEDLEQTRSLVMFLQIPTTLKLITQLLADADWL